MVAITSKLAGGKITGLLALTVEAQEAVAVGDWVQVSDDYEVELADGTKPVLGRVSVANVKRTISPTSTSFPVANVPGDVTVEARGLMVATVESAGAIVAGELVGIGATGLVAAGTGVATIGIALMAAGAAGVDVDVLVQ